MRLFGLWMGIVSMAAGMGAGFTRPSGPPTVDPTYGLAAPAPSKQAPILGADAMWIWGAHPTDQQALGVRRDFSLDRKPDTAALWVTADNYFTAWVNGAQVGQTRMEAGNDLVWKDVRRYDVTSLLRPGHNAIAIQGRNAGGAAGVIAVLQIVSGSQKVNIVTNATWRLTEEMPAGWEKLDADSSHWPAATVEAPLAGGIWQGGLNNWPGLTGTASYLARMMIPVKKVVSIDPHGGKIEGASSLVGSRLTHVRFSLPSKSGPSAEADSPAVVLDFGQETSGKVEVSNNSTGPIDITLRYGESEAEARNGPYTGVQKLTIPPHGVGAGMDSAFRYAIVTVVNAPRGQAEISRIRLNMDYYPVTYRGSFDCSDPLLTRIWYTGAYTAHLCMQQDIWDAPKRDRARWMGDLHVSGEVINNAFLDRFEMEQTMDRLRAEAGTPPHGHVNGIPGYSCAWVAGMADFYRHTGDTAYILRHHDDLVQMMEFFRGELDDRGIFANKRGQWDFVDWSPGFNGGGPHSLTATHFFMIKMLRDGAWLLEEMGDSATAATYRQWADDATAAAQKYLLDTATNTFGDRWQDNAMAIYSGATTAEQRAAIWEKVLSRMYPVEQMITPYYNNYDIFAMAEAGHTAGALQFVRDYWGGMMAEGATTFWEGYDTRWPKADFHKNLQADNGMGYFVSLCHGWSAGATNLLTERILGVRSLGPGFREVIIQPQLCDLRWASGVIPTPYGNIKVRYEVQGSEMTSDIDLPHGVRAAITLPGRSKSKVSGGHVHAVSVLGGRPGGT